MTSQTFENQRFDVLRPFSLHEAIHETLQTTLLNLSVITLSLSPGTLLIPSLAMWCQPSTGTTHMDAPVHASAIITSARFFVLRLR